MVWSDVTHEERYWQDGRPGSFFFWCDICVHYSQLKIGFLIHGGRTFPTFFLENSAPNTVHDAHRENHRDSRQRRRLAADPLRELARRCSRDTGPKSLVRSAKAENSQIEIPFSTGAEKLVPSVKVQRGRLSLASYVEDVAI